MLTHLAISNFAIIDQLSIDWEPNLSVITGETGSGKSIAIDALTFCLGERGSATVIKNNAETATVSADFDISNAKDAKNLLDEFGISFSDNQLTIRRSINKAGKSKAFINGHPSPINNVKQLGEILISIHSQNAHQKMLKQQNQQELLDTYSGETKLINEVKSCYIEIKQCKKALLLLRESNQKMQSTLQLLQFQEKELNDFAPMDNEFESLEGELSRLSNAAELVSNSQLGTHLLSGDNDQSIMSQLSSLKHTINAICEMDPNASSMLETIESAYLDISELSRELDHYSQHIEVDESALHAVENRYSQYIELSRKYQCQPNDISSKYDAIKNELDAFNSSSQNEEELDAKIASLESSYGDLAQSLHESRTANAEILSSKISDAMKSLNMPDGVFIIDVKADFDNPTQTGVDSINFIASINPGMPPQPINKAASGGELSRISLALQVAVSESKTSPTIIFDEVDVGISGGTAAIVGTMLKRLSENAQVISITHLPQVACYGHQHYLVEKSKREDGTTTTETRMLNIEQREIEIARIVGGKKVSETTIANARELLNEGTCA